MTSISLLRPVALYTQITDHYRSLISSGDLQPGDRIPTVTQMAATWTVSPGTAHRAVRELRNEGLVTITRQGTTVQRGAAA